MFLLLIKRKLFSLGTSEPHQQQAAQPERNKNGGPAKYQVIALCRLMARGRCLIARRIGKSNVSESARSYKDQCQRKNAHRVLQSSCVRRRQVRLVSKKNIGLQ